MKRLCMVLGVLLAGLTAASPTEAISAGPGGRLYITYRYYDTDCATFKVALESLKIGTDWEIDFEGRAASTFAEHGSLRDGYAYGSSVSVCGISPEIYSSAGNGYGAKLVMGLFYNNTPGGASAVYKPGGTYDGRETMDVLQVTTTAAPGMSVTILGDGAGAPDARQTWQGGYLGEYPSTERGYFAAPDPGGGFTGDARNRYLTNGFDLYHYAVSINTDTHGDGDITDNVDDYLDYTDQTIDSERDHEILGNRMYVSSTYNTWMPSTHGIGYYQSEPNTITRHAYIWRDDNMLTQWANPDGGPNQGFYPICSGIAATKIPDESGVYHDAVFTVARTGWDWIGGPTGYNSYVHVALCMDLNNDGDAMDNEIGEIQYIYGTDSAANGLWDNPPPGGFSDIELVKNEQDDNQMFLICQQTVDLGVDPGYALLVIQLDSFGRYVGGDNGVHLILQTYNTGWEYSLASIEFDMVPEPGMLVLWGTGVVGFVGWLRRRRMK